MNKVFFVVLLIGNCALLNAQKIGVNNENPAYTLDIFSTNSDSAATLQMATPDFEHFLRLYAGHGGDPRPFVLFNNRDTFRIAASDAEFGGFQELVTIMPNGFVAINQGNTAEINERFVVYSDSSFYVVLDDQKCTQQAGVNLNLDGSTDRGQTISSGMIGQWVGLSIFVNSVDALGANALLKVNIYDGDNPGGSLMFSQNLSVGTQVLSPQHITIDPPISIDYLGQAFFIEIEHTGGGNAVWRSESGNPYTGGSAWLKDKGAYTGLPNSDMFLETQVSTEQNLKLKAFTVSEVDGFGKAKIGINADSPVAALDVNGKLKVGNDDLAPYSGMIRYNNFTNRFEGYNGISWLAFTQSGPESSYHPISDIEGNNYKTVVIGSQTWMRENLRTATYTDGTPISEIALKDQWNTTSPAWCWYANDPAYDLTYGKLYNFYALDPASNGNRNICPTGWHIPTANDWNTLETFLGGSSVAGGSLKTIGTFEAGTGMWADPNTGASNCSGFSARPNGYRRGANDSPPFFYFGLFYSQYGVSYWWSDQSTSPTTATARFIEYNTSSLSTQSNNKRSGFSIRCLLD